ncbi:Transposable element tcb2 transposase [Caligus rogercresseyi]|uniref:Transposable element tcb2 transposase n=1 Tax=Caligus rogercresseyi TaxID=217165 RepID=A0A7T8HLB0_CALRO|nr:Transposable element tcb2 transposase [Caligus rogercresseyi]
MCVRNRFLVSAYSLPLGYLSETAAVGLRMLLTEQIVRRGAMVCGFRAGRTNIEIATFNNIPHGTVRNFRMTYNKFVEDGGKEEEFDVTNGKRKRRSDAHDDDIVDNIQQIIDKDPGRSMRGIARELSVSDFLVRKIVKQDIRYKSYSLRRGQFMSAATKERRAERAAALLNKFKHPPDKDMLIFYSDEKNFNQDQKVNKKNNRWLCSDPSEVPIVMATKFPATVMVLGVISNKGDVMPPHVFEAGLRVNSKVYLDVLKNIVKPWMDQVAGDRPYLWQQDGAPAHTAKKVQDWCEDNFPHFWGKEVWPPSSPDLNPLDFFVWGVAERDTNRSPHSTKQSLINSITEVFANFDRESVVNACSRVRSRLEEVVDAKGDFIR